MVTPLVKAHAYGNDFILIQAEAVPARADLAAIARHVCDRRHAIGADGLIVVHDTALGATTEIFNADGSRPEVSGNGLRCVAATIAEQRRLPVGASVEIQTDAGNKALKLIEKTANRYTFRADMGTPEAVRRQNFDVGGHTVAAIVLRVGNPQCVVLGPATPADLHSVAAALAVHPAFPQGTNVEVAMVEAPGRVRILIWERGVGPTEASGTGACAAAVAAASYGGADRTVDVVSPGGTQHVEWTEQAIWLTGWAEIIGTIDWRGWPLVQG